MTNMDDFLNKYSTPSGALNWFDYFYGETIPKKRFKPYNHSKRKRQEYHFNFNGYNCDQCQVISINGLPCHESGCVNSHKTYNHTERRWVEYIACSECGYDVESGNTCDCTSHRNPDFGYFDDDDVLLIEQNLNYTSIWQQYDQ